MAGDERTGVCVMRLTAGPRLGPGRAPRGGRDRRRGRLRGALGRARGARRRAAGQAPRPARGRATSSFAEQDDAGATYAEKIDPAERRLDPARPAAELARTVRALTPHVGAYLETGERRAARGAARARRSTPAVRTGDAPRRVGGAAARLRPRRPAARGGPAGGRQADGGRRLPARPLAAEAVIADGAAPARASRSSGQTFEDGAYTERAFRAAADAARARRPRAGPGAAARLRRGPAARHDRRRDRAARRAPPRLLDPPVLAALRLGLYELLFADGTPDHAAVDQAVELVKARRAPPTPPASSTRSCAGPPASASELTAALLDDDSTPEARRGRPLGAALAGADVVGGARARRRAVAARRLQRAGRGRVPGQRPTRRDETAGGARARPGSRSPPRPASGRWRRRR